MGTAFANDIADISADLEASLVAEIEAGGVDVAEPGGEDLDTESNAPPRGEGHLDDADLANVKPPDEATAQTKAPEEPVAPAAPVPDEAALAAIEQREYASRERVAADRHKLQQEIEAFKEGFAKQYPSELLERAAELQQLGSLGDRELAEYYYRKHKAASGEPGYEREAQSMRHQSVVEQRFAKIEADNQALRDQLQRRREQEDGDRFIGEAASATAADVHPHLHRWLEVDKPAAREAIARHAILLHRQTGELPKPSDVLLSLEKQREATFAKLGYVPKSVAVAPTQTPTTAPETPAANSSESSTSNESEADELEAREQQAIREIADQFGLQ